MTEKDLTNQIIETLNYSGMCFCWKVNSGMIKAQSQGRTRMIRMAKAGTSDIQGIMRDGKNKGRTICLEVKLPKTIKTLTDLQQEYLEKMSGYGAIAGVVVSSEQAIELIKLYY